MLALAAVSFPAIVPSHMTHRVAFTHATGASHPADIGEPKVSGGPNLVTRAPSSLNRTELQLIVGCVTIRGNKEAATDVTLLLQSLLWVGKVIDMIRDKPRRCREENEIASVLSSAVARGLTSATVEISVH